MTYRWALAVAAWMAMAPAGARYHAAVNGEVVQLEDSASHIVVSILPSVGNIAFKMTVEGRDVLRWPFRSVDEFKAAPAMSGIPFLGPWANRLDEPAFYANGRKYAFDMTLGNVRGAIPIHGFLTTTADWHLVEVKADARAAWETSRLEFFREPAWMKQWPFAHTIQMTYQLQDGVLEVRTRIANVSNDAMPVAIGFHPYFQLTDAPRDEWTLAVGARLHWRLTPEKIPTGETEPADRVLDPPSAASLRHLALDDVFGDLVRDAYGRSTMSVAGKQQRLDVVLGPRYRATVIWAPAAQEFVCIEPMTGITDALNLSHRGVYSELQSIPPGGAWEESFWIRPSGFSREERPHE